INLKIAKDRKEYMQNLCLKHNLDYEIIQAVDGKELDSDFVKNISDFSLSEKYLGRTLSLGEIGCALSHKKCFERMFELNLNECLILEDDAYFDEKLNYILSLKDKFPKDLELFLLGHYRQVYLDDGFRIESPFSLRYDYKIDDFYHAKRLVGGGNGTHGYYINKNGALKMYKYLEKIIFPYDHCTSNDNIINVYALYPVVITTDEIFGAQTYVQDDNKRRYRKRSKISKYIKKIKNKIIFFIPSLKKLRKYE
ncbi:glycosyltransferase family 25 protein, partial [Campylobacter jejuni]|nr:glycosyltransferase family 25 protein [Campylobacter jejuni]EAK5423080.1 glycosyltransferase family 25 protein [Campylobacter jejuni]EAL8545165.1 glycosyltransferase [Campylobacter jejuni]EDP5826395.1 glycosyltransferase family 25 protein [Campylobacter jejuni]EFP6590240.1 glycosyltransferase family 25 protein [Campylobacter jejuni]